MNTFEEVEAIARIVAWLRKPRMTAGDGARFAAALAIENGEHLKLGSYRPGV